MTSTALITGVGRRRGIGAGIAAGLAADGWDLALSYWTPYDDRIDLDRGADDPHSLAEELRATGRRIELIPADLADPAAASALVDQASERLGSLDALVMSHCESVDSSILDTTVESFDRHYAVNVRAVWLLIAAFARSLADRSENHVQTEQTGQAGQPGASVIALTSDHTVHNLPYGATMGALDRLVLASAHELGHLGLRANVINPGPIDTGWMSDEIRASGLAQQPTGRLGRPDDIANLVRFLVSEQGSWINGQLLYSNGGFPTGRLPV